MPRRTLQLNLKNLITPGESPQNSPDSVSPLPPSDESSTPLPPQLAATPLNFISPPPGLAIAEKPQISSTREPFHDLLHDPECFNAPSRLPNSSSSPNAFHDSVSSGSCSSSQTPRQRTFYPDNPFTAITHLHTPRFFSHSSSKKKLPKEEFPCVKMHLPTSHPVKSDEPDKISFTFLSETHISNYPFKYKGFLEIHSQTEKFNAMLRQLFGIDSFAEPSTLGLFARNMVTLNSHRVFVSGTGLTRIVTNITSILVQELREALLEFDRTMSYLLSHYPEDYIIYCNRMKRAFFPKEAARNFETIFNFILKNSSGYSFLTKKDRIIADLAHEQLSLAFQKYAVFFDKKQMHFELKKLLDAKVAALRDKVVVLENEKRLACENHTVDGPANFSHPLKMLLRNRTADKYDNEIVSLNREIQDTDRMILSEEQKMQKEDFNLAPEFKPYIIKGEFLSILYRLSSEEKAKMNRDKKRASFLPKLQDEKINAEILIQVCNHFLDILYGLSPYFYNIASIEKDIYLNEKYNFELQYVATPEEFEIFMRNKHAWYIKELLKIVLFKSIDYINAEINGTLDKDTLFMYVLGRMDASMDLMPTSKVFFEIAMTYALEQIQQNFCPHAQSSPLFFPEKMEEESADDKKIFSDLSGPSQKREEPTSQKTSNWENHSSSLFFLLDYEQEETEHPKARVLKLE